MDWDIHASTARARYFVEHVTPQSVDDDLSAPVTEWPPLLNRRLAARFLSISMVWLSTLSGDGPKGGRLRHYKVRGKVFWKLAGLQAYAQEREQVRREKQRDKKGHYVG